MQIKTKVEYAHRFDGNYNIWVKQDAVYHDDSVPLYGEWQIIEVCANRQAAVQAWREAKAARR